MIEIHPLLILFVGTITVVGMIIILRMNAFIALISSAMIVSLLSPGNIEEKIVRVALSFGNTAGGIGIVIALATVIGKCMMDSGAADRIVQVFLKLFGEKKTGLALMSSGFILSVPVFFDTVFYLLIPLARSMYKRTGKHYLKYIMAITAGGVITHMLVPPTPGPLVMAQNLGFDIGMMIIVGLVVALPAATVGMIFSWWRDRSLDIPMRPLYANDEPKPKNNEDLPGLFVSLLPIMLPVILVSANTIVKNLLLKAELNSAFVYELSKVTAIIGNVNFAMLLSAAVALFVLVKKRKLSREALSNVVEKALMSGGVIILITAAGGAFGAMLQAAEIGPAIENIFLASGIQTQGLFLLGLAFIMASIMKIAQGSGTVAMITTSAMLASMMTTPEQLGFHPVYLATAIGSGSMIFSWMNDSGFWIFTKMGGLEEIETLKTWTPLLSLVGLTGMIVTVILSLVFPLI